MRSMRWLVGAMAGCLGAFLLAASVPAHAAKSPTSGNLYPSVGYTSPPNNTMLPLATPTLDLTGASIGYDGTFLRFTANVLQPSLDAPTPFRDQEYYFRIKWDKVQAVLVYFRYTPWQLGLQAMSYEVGTTSAGADSLSAATCGSCYGTVNLDRGLVEFSITLDDLNSIANGTQSTGFTPVLPGTKVHFLEVDSAAGYPDPAVTQPISLTADVASAPKNFPAYVIPG